MRKIIKFIKEFFINFLLISYYSIVSIVFILALVASILEVEISVRVFGIVGNSLLAVISIVTDIFLIKETRKELKECSNNNEKE